MKHHFIIFFLGCSVTLLTVNLCVVECGRVENHVSVCVCVSADVCLYVTCVC